MKTTTYLRFSLLIPFLVWGICLLILIVSSTILPAGAGFDGLEGMVNLVLLPLLFYVFGIIGWLLPYLVLALVLLIWSFRSRSPVLMKVFALSPLGMAILILILVQVWSIGNQGWSLFSSHSTANGADILGSSAWFVVLTLGWGYICVGMGYALYKILQRVGFVRDELKIPFMPLSQPASTE